MENFNFLDNYSSLKKWEKIDSNIELEDNSNESYLNISNFRKDKIVLLFKNNKYLLIPPLSIMGMTFAIFAISIIPRLNSWRLTNKVILFDSKYIELQDANNQIKSISKSISNHIPTFDIKSPVLLFSYFLQNALPEEVSVIDYSIDNRTFVINASSNDIDKLNVFINAINQMPLTEKNSLKVKKLIDNSSQGNQSNQQVSNLGNINLELEGNLNLMKLEEKIKYLKEVYNFGEVRKIEQLVNLINTFKI